VCTKKDLQLASIEPLDLPGPRRKAEVGCDCKTRFAPNGKTEMIEYNHEGSHPVQKKKAARAIAVYSVRGRPGAPSQVIRPSSVLKEQINQIKVIEGVMSEEEVPQT